MSTENAIQHNM